MHGVRIFDIRIAKVEEELKYYVVHRFAFSLFETVLNDICRFMKENTSEIIIIKLTCTYMVDNGEIEDLLERIVGDLILTSYSRCLHDITIGEILRSGRRLIMCFPHHNKYFRPDDIFIARPISLINSMMHKYVHEEHCLQEYSKCKKNYMVSWTLTPSMSNIISSIFQRPFSLKEYVSPLQQKLRKFINSLSSAEKAAIGAIDVDFVDVTEVVSVCMALNSERAKYLINNFIKRKQIIF